MWKKNTLIILIILFVDQATKSLAASGDLLFQGPLLSFTYVENTGSAFGMLQGANQYLVWVSIIFIGLIMIYYHNIEEKSRPALALIAGGILGNLIDRMVLGYVIDFIDLGWWPVFNIADSAMVLGVAWLIVDEIRNQNSSVSSKASR